MRPILCIATIMLVAGLSSCQNSNVRAKNNNSLAQINTTISVDDFEKKLMSDVQLIDVRTPDEFNQGHLKGARNYNINSDDFDKQISGLNKNIPVLVYCLSGGRSASAAEIMEEKGFTEVYNMQGGIMKWNSANKPLDDGTSNTTNNGLSMDDFLKLLKTDKYVLVDYNAKWCKPCIKMAPMLAKFEESKKDKLILVKIDADKNKHLLKEKGIESLPVLELYKDGKLIWTHEGEIDETSLINEIKL